MAHVLATSILDFLQALVLNPAGQEASNRLTIEGLGVGPAADGALAIRIGKLEAASLRLASGPVVLEVGRAAVYQLSAQVRFEHGRPRVSSLEAANAEVSGVTLQGPVSAPAAGESAPGEWHLGPLAAVNGSLKAEIVDAHLIFDANVAVPIRQGTVDFNEATVEHVGPDSRMGVSRLGVYVDAPNGRSYLYQFPSTPVAGVEFERRGALLGPRITNRGHLQLQAFAEGLMRQRSSGPGTGLTEQARLLFDRTAVAGEVRLGDGRFAAPGVQADLIGQAQGRNTVRLHSQAVGRGLSADIAALAVRHARLRLGGLQLACDDLTASSTLRLMLEGDQLRFAFDLPDAKLSVLRLEAAPARTAASA